MGATLWGLRRQRSWLQHELGAPCHRVFLHGRPRWLYRYCSNNGLFCSSSMQKRLARLTSYRTATTCTNNFHDFVRGFSMSLGRPVTGSFCMAGPAGCTCSTAAAVAAASPRLRSTSLGLPPSGFACKAGAVRKGAAGTVAATTFVFCATGAAGAAFAVGITRATGVTTAGAG